MSSLTQAQQDVVFALNDLAAAQVLARIASTHGWNVHVATSEVDALDSTEGGVLVIDLGDDSPHSGERRIDGEELVRNLHAIGIEPRVIALTSTPTVAAYRRALAVDAREVLEAPLVPDDLLTALDRVSADRVRKNQASCADQQTLEFGLPTKQGAAETAARDLIAWCARCEVAPPARARIGSAVAEVVQNAIDHGAETVRVSSTIEARTLHVRVVDDGPGFDPVTALTDDALDSSSGLGRVHALTEDVTFDSHDGHGTRVDLSFGVSTVEFGDAARIDLSDLDYFASATSRELLATLDEDPHAPVILSPALAVVVGRLLAGPDPSRVLREALRTGAR